MGEPMTPNLDVICVGAANLDTIASVDHPPAEDERVVTTAFLKAGGGPAATAAVALSRLGARVGICAIVGDDYAGEFVRARLVEENVDTTWLRTDPTVRTSEAFVLASRGSDTRSIVTTTAPAPRVVEIPIGASTWLHVDQTGFANTWKALAGSGNATKFSVDAGNPTPALDLRRVDLYAPTLSALLSRYRTDMIQAAFAAARDEGAQDIVATAGKAGTYVLGPSGVELIGSFDVEIESTIGAGDVFHGALLAELVRGESLVAATRAANAAAALSCAGMDGRSAIPTLVELRRFLQHHLPRPTTFDALV